MRSPQGVLAWAKAHPQNPGSGGPNWNNDCVQFIWYSGGFPLGNSAATANLARAATLAHGHELTLDYTPPFGWFVYFDGPTKAGHIGMSVGGGKFISATIYENDPNYGPNLGVMTISGYDAIRGVTYKGASPYFVNLTLDLTAASGGSGTPISPDNPNDPTAPPIEEPDMGDIRYLHKNGDESAVEYGIFGRELPGGYKVSTDVKDGEAWGRMYGRGDGSPWISNLTRAQWINTQRAAVIEHNDWKAQQASTTSALPLEIAGALQRIETAVGNLPAAIATDTANRLTS